MYDYIFLDLDGTLTDPFLGITNSVKYALKKFNINKTNTELKCYIGPPLIDSFMDFEHFSLDDARLAVKYYREYFAEKGIFENFLYKDTIELLESLTKLGKKIILATSKPDKFSITILKHFNIYYYFDFCACSTFDEKRTSKAEVIKYAIDSLNIKDTSKILMVGDRFHDVVGAKSNNIDSCYVTYGYGSIDEANEYKPTYIINEMLDLLKII